MYPSVLVPVDGSGPSRKALEVAVELVDPEGRLYLLNVREPPLAADELGRAAGVPAADAEERVQGEGAAVIDRIREAAGVDAARTESIVVAGQPARTIVDEAQARGVAAIVIGSRGVSDIASLTLGSVSHRVLHVAPCTVILVH